MSPANKINGASVLHLIYSSSLTVAVVCRPKCAHQQNSSHGKGMCVCVCVRACVRARARARVRACAILCLRACVSAFMLCALNFDKYVFVENV